MSAATCGTAAPGYRFAHPGYSYYSDRCAFAYMRYEGHREKTMTTISRHASRIVSALAAVLVAAAPAAAQVEFKAGIADPVNTVLAWWMPKAGGFYGTQGLNVDVLNM